MLASTSGGGRGLGRAWANITPDDIPPDAVDGCPPAIPAGELTTISQPLTTPATIDRLPFGDILTNPFRCA